MKTLCLVSHSLSVSQELKNQLLDLLEKYVTVTSWAMDIEEQPPAQADLYVASFLSVYREAESKLPPGSRIIRARRFFNPVQFQKLLSLPKGTRVLICANSRLSCAVSLKALRQYGLTHIECVMHDPAHPVPESEGIHIALVAGANKTVPEYVTQLIDIGIKDLAITTYMEIMKAFDIPLKIVDDVMRKYVSQIFDVTCKHYMAEKTMRSIVQCVDDAIFTITQQGTISISNSSAARLFPDVNFAGGESFASVFPKLHLPLPLPLDYSLSDEVVERDGHHYVVTVESLRERFAGAVVMVKPASRLQELDVIVRHEIKRGSNKTKYCFANILTDDTGMGKTIELARRFAGTRLAVLLEGESGVGKELFAHAVHAASTRSQGPFVAINLAAMPENLAESELFGYMDGAFTGARRGGQRGLFEEAHQGTIFLDEVGDAPLALQTKLLRVLEENEVRRVGGKSSVPVDVRVIAATNKDLIDMVRNGQFRTDLFFRLCACPLHIPPLRERTADIFLLFSHYSRLMRGVSLGLDPELESFLSSYAWPGNVRELQNVIGYLVNVVPQHERAKLEHLPQYLVKSVRNGHASVLAPQSAGKGTPPPAQGNADLDQWESRLSAQGRKEASRLILECLRHGWAGRTPGRSAIFTALTERGYAMSLYELRSCLRILRDAGFLSVGKTRQGCSILPPGEAFLRHIARPA